MKFSTFSLFFIICLFTNCGQTDSTLQTELESLQAAFQQKSTEYANLQKEMLSLQSQSLVDAPLIHLVFFKVKDDISEANKTTLLNTLKGLADIEVVKDFEVGEFEDLGDKRALSDYDVAIEMGFLTKEDYEKYQSDERHLQAKEALKPFLAGPPASYDFRVE